MSRRLVGATALTALVLSASAAVAAPGLPAGPVRAAAPVDLAADATGDLHAFVQFAGPVRDRDVRALAALGITRMRRFSLTPAVAVVAPRLLLEKAALLPGVVRVQQDHGIKPTLDESKKAIRAVDGAVKGASARALGLDGKGVNVAVLDTGFDVNHPDLDAGKFLGTFNFEGSYLYDQYQDGRLSDRAAEGTGAYAGVDENGHGTHVSSTIAGTGEGSLSGRDFTGVAPAASLYGFKVYSPAQTGFDFGWEANSMAAIEYIAEHPDLGIKVVSNSWSIYEVDDPDTEPIIQMVRAAVAKRNLVFVFAAGNDGPSEGTVAWPGAIGPVITVASTEKTGTGGKYAMSSFSSRGVQVDIAAPGSDIIAARAAGTSDDLGLSVPDLGPDAARYMAISGTSMATPHIAGVAALLLQANPALTARQVEEVLERTAVDLGSKGKDTSYGYGFVDAYRAGLVAQCSAKADLDGCIAQFQGLPEGAGRSAWADDWADRGDEGPTAQGDDLPLPVA
ncbi:MAG: peptidase family protein [Frankiales bacterium]|nr:peptidase family protein [Frankiales bacterium]